MGTRTVCCISTANDRPISIMSPPTKTMHTTSLSRLTHIYMYTFSWAKIVQPFWDRYWLSMWYYIFIILYYDICYIPFCKTLNTETKFTWQQGLLPPIVEVQADGKGNALPWDLPLLRGQDPLWKCQSLLQGCSDQHKPGETSLVLLPLPDLCQSNLRLHLPASVLFSFHTLAFPLSFLFLFLLCFRSIWGCQVRLHLLQHSYNSVAKNVSKKWYLKQLYCWCKWVASQSCLKATCEACSSKGERLQAKVNTGRTSISMFAIILCMPVIE